MLPFILTSLAGLSTLLGSLLIFLKIKPNKIIYFSLAFAAGIMLSVSFFDLIPVAINYLSNTVVYKNKIFIIILIYLIIGIIIIHLLNIKISKKFKQNELYNAGIFSFITMILHNIPEGIITYITSSENLTLGITITIAIAMHNIPEGMSIAVPIFYSKKSKKKALLYTLVAALSEPFGALFTFLILKPFINEQKIAILLIIVAGIMIYISFFKLLNLALKYEKSYKTIVSLSLGILFVILSILIFN